MTVQVCPKCNEQGPFVWLRTKNGKWWLKRSLGDGQAVNEWHTCINQDPKKQSNATSICGDCGSKCYNCDYMDCPLCKIFPCYCKTCDTHPAVVNRQ